MEHGVSGDSRSSTRDIPETQRGPVQQAKLDNTTSEESSEAQTSSLSQYKGGRLKKDSVSSRQNSFRRDGSASASPERKIKSHPTNGGTDIISSQLAPGFRLRKLGRPAPQSESYTVTEGEGARLVGMWKEDHERLRKEDQERGKSGGRGIGNFTYLSCRADCIHKEEALIHAPIFSDCSAEFISELAKASLEKEIDAGVQIVVQSTPGESLLVCERGTIRMMMGSSVAGYLHRGDIFGETNFLGIDMMWQATLIAETTAVILELPRKVPSVEGSCELEWNTLQEVRRVHSQRVFQRAGTLERTISLFSEISDNVLRAIQQECVRRLFFPGQTIVREHDAGAELYIVVLGKVSVRISGKIIRRMEANQKSNELLFFGELTLLGIEHEHRSSVMAQSICQVRILNKDSFWSCHAKSSRTSLNVSAPERLVARYDRDRPSRETTADSLVGIHFLSDCQRPILEFLAHHLEGRLFASGTIIRDENSVVYKCMYLVERGTVTIIKGVENPATGERPKRYTVHKGASFGERDFLGIDGGQPLQIMAAEACYVHILHLAVLCRGLELYPEERRRVLDSIQKRLSMTDAVAWELKENTVSFAEFAKSLPGAPLTTNAGFLDELGRCATLRVLLPGDYIVKEGERGTSMYVMASGSASVWAGQLTDNMAEEFGNQTEQVAKTVTGGQAPAFGVAQASPRRVSVVIEPHALKSMISMLQHGSVISEMTMLGVSTLHLANVEATTACQIWEIPADGAIAAINRSKSVREHFAHRIRLHMETSVVPRMLSLAMFSDFDQRFRTTVGPHSERKVYFVGQVIAKENDKGLRAMLVLNAGKALWKKSGVDIRTLLPGATFGAAVLMGVDMDASGKGYMGTLTAAQTCHVIAVTNEAYQKALKAFPPEHGSTMESMLNKVKQQERELYRISQMIVWRTRHMSNYDIIHSRDITDPTSTTIAHNVSKESLTRDLFDAWHTFAKLRSETRKKSDARLAQASKGIERWKEQRVAATSKAQERERLRREGVLQAPQSARLPGEVVPGLSHVDTMESVYVLQTTRSARSWRPKKKPPAGAEWSWKLPAVRACAESDPALGAVLQEWPSPRPSPHYSLRFPEVLAMMKESNLVLSALGPLKSVEQPPSTASTALPPLSPPGTAQSQRGAAMEGPISSRRPVSRSQKTTPRASHAQGLGPL